MESEERNVYRERGNANGSRKREHVIIAEKALGHALPLGAVVHHVNERKPDNRNANLVICQDEIYHRLIHRRMRAFRATGSASAMKCAYCKQWSTVDDPTMYICKNKRDAYHRPCHAAYEDQRRRRAHNKEVASGIRL